MINTCTDAQIKAAYENEQMTVAEIAEEFGFEEIAVKAKLMQISSGYRKACMSEGEDIEEGLNFTNEELRRVNKQIVENATSATLPDGTPDYKTMQRACEYIRDDKKGRRDAIKHMKNSPYQNIFQINNILQQARLGAEEAKRSLHNGGVPLLELKAQ